VETLRQVTDTETQTAPAITIQTESRPDLETICLSELEKQPQPRYNQPPGLGRELERFLRQEPIRARPRHGFESGVKW